MSLPANIRVNVGSPFPATVKGAGPIAITKQNGIWTIGFSIGILGAKNPPASDFNTDFVIVYDSINNTFFKMPISALHARQQRSVTAGPVSVTSTDDILNLNLAASLVIPLPSYATRNGLPLTFKDVGKKCGLFPQTITAAPGEFIDGMASIPLNVAGESINLIPANDGVNTGWFIE